MSQKKVIDDLDIAVKQTTQDFIDACKEELAKFKPADPITSKFIREQLKQKINIIFLQKMTRQTI